MVRPRGGDFNYDDLEYASMRDDVHTIATMGFPGLVIGILNSAGDVDIASGSLTPPAP